MALAWVNGELVDERAPSVAVADPGFSVGDGVFTTTVVDGGRIFALEAHLHRLRTSLAAIGLPVPDEAPLRAGVAALLAARPQPTGRLRITVTPGSGEGATIAITLGPWAPHDGAAAVVTLPWRRNEHGALVGVKSVSFGEWALAQRELRRLGADEGILGNTAGELCEGVGSNVFVAVGGRLLTPPLVSGCLPGVARSIVVQMMSVHEEPVPLSLLAAADEIFLTSSTRGVQPVGSLDGRPLPAPGPLTIAARAAFGGVAW